MNSSTPRFSWDLLAATFAALTAVFAKVGIQGADSSPKNNSNPRRML
jgi:uncharacterized membrane protein